MKLREIKVQNFRCLADVTIPIGDTTVLVGANNSGKTALLDALRIALTGNRANRGMFFDEYDYHMTKAGDSPQTSQGTRRRESRGARRNHRCPPPRSSWPARC